MRKSQQGALLFLGIIVLAFLIGSYILTAVFFGLLMLVGLIALIESIPPLRWIMCRTSRVVDIIIFVLSIMAMASYGLNITAALTVAGVGYTLCYAPYLRETEEIRKSMPKQDNGPSYKSKFK